MSCINILLIIYLSVRPSVRLQTDLSVGLQTDLSVGKVI